MNSFLSAMSRRGVRFIRRVLGVDGLSQSSYQTQVSLRNLFEQHRTIINKLEKLNLSNASSRSETAITKFDRTENEPLPIPRVSVLVLAYNHEKFIAQALGSILMQQTSFYFEVVIGEDCSGDDTFSICSEFESRYPGRILLLRREHNLGINQNLRDTLNHCRGEYVALIEGDDFWIKTDKLQLQVDYMDARPAYTMCGTSNFEWSEWNEGSMRIFRSLDYKNTISVHDVIAEKPYATATILFRRGVVESLPTWLDGLEIGDLPLIFLHAEKGPLGYIPIVSAVYRQHSTSSFFPKPMSEKVSAAIKMLECLDEHSTRRFHNQFLAAIGYRRSLAVESLLNENDIDEARKWFEQGICDDPANPNPMRIKTIARRFN